MWHERLIVEWRGKLTVIRCDNVREYISQMLADWAEDRGIRLDFIQQGNLQQNAYVERYSWTVRYDWLTHYLFEFLEDVQNHAQLVVDLQQR